MGAPRPIPVISTACILSVGLLAKAFLHLLTKVRVQNLPVLLHAIHKRPPGVPLITVSNHTSTLDDPLMFGILPTTTLLDTQAMRWSLGAKDVIFLNPLYSAFFSAGKVLPVVRGAGIHQPAMDAAVDLLGRGDWVHVFPEGRITQDSSALRTRLKWGISRLLLEPARPPILLPIIHRGFEKIKPLDRCIRPFQYLDILVGDPVDSACLRSLHKDGPLDAKVQRMQVVDFVTGHMRKQYGSAAAG